MRSLLAAVQALVLALIGYNLATAAFGWTTPPPTPRGGRNRRFRVVIPAHNEAKVIGRLLEDLARQDYPKNLVRVCVVADRCTDHTAQLARRAGVEVAERTGGPDGKGPALAWYLDNHPLDPDEELVVLDADNRIPDDLLARLADELDAGHQALQAYLDVANPDRSMVAVASALSYWASNRMVQLARRNLGWPADLGGTGMCITAPALQKAGGFGHSAAEDQELGVRLFLAGVPVVWVHHAKVYDEKPVKAAVAARQRGRWASGRRQVARRYLGRLLRTGRPAGWDLALRLVQPSRMGVALGSLVLAAASALGAPLLPARWWLAVTGLQVAAPIPFLVKEGVEGRYLVRYPLLVVLPLLKAVGRILGRPGWYHTPHGEDA